MKMPIRKTYMIRPKLFRLICLAILATIAAFAWAQESSNYTPFAGKPFFLLADASYGSKDIARVRLEVPGRDVNRAELEIYSGADIAVYIPCVFTTGYTSPPSVAQMLTDIVVCPGLASSVSVPYPPTSFPGTNMWSIITPTSRGQAVEDLLTKSNEQLSWEFRNGVLQVERVGGAVDPARVFPITHDTPGVTVDLDLVSDTKPDAFLLTYTCAGVATTSYYPFNPPSPTAMVETLAIGGDNVSTAEAQTQANQEWMRRSSHVADGAIGVTGGLRSNAGTWTPAPLLRAGDYVDVTDMVGHAPMMITGVAYDTASNQATLTVGGLETRRIIVPGAPIATRTYSAPVAAAPTAQIMGGVAHP